MSYATSSHWGPTHIPSVIKHLIIWTSLITLLSALIQTLLDRFGVSPGPQDLLSLSSMGVHRGYLWQLLSYLFIQESPDGISLPFLLQLLFNMYILWVIGVPLVDLIGKWSFLRLYLISGIAAAIITSTLLSLFGIYFVIAGAGPALLAALIVWSLAFPDVELLLFFLIPIKIKWLVTGIIGGLLLITISQWDVVNLILYFSSLCIGYGYATMVQGWNSPFAFTHPVDAKLAALGLHARRYIPHWRSGKVQFEQQNKDKIIDIRTGKAPSDDEAFVDAMLAKISLYGERSLSWNERRRLQEISERKRK